MNMDDLKIFNSACRRLGIYPISAYNRTEKQVKNAFRRSRMKHKMPTFKIQFIKFRKFKKQEKFKIEKQCPI